MIVLSANRLGFCPDFVTDYELGPEYMQIIKQKCYSVAFLMKAVHHTHSLVKIYNNYEHEFWVKKVMSWERV